MKPRKHAEFIKLWADGVQLQFRQLEGRGPTLWMDITSSIVAWDSVDYLRVKPKEVERYAMASWASMTTFTQSQPEGFHNLKLTFVDGKLMAAEVIK